MSKDPAFLFYSNDFLTGVAELTMQERGQYITLLCLQHQKGGLTQKIIDINTPGVSKDVMVKFKKKATGIFFNERLEKEIIKRKKYSKKQSDRAKKRWNTTADATALPKIENVNVNDNVIEVDGKGSVRGKPKKETYAESVTMTNAEYNALIEKFDVGPVNWMVDKLNNYTLSSGKNYKSDYRAILSWVVDEWKKQKSTKNEKVSASDILQQKYGISQT